jgi:ubiquinone/menaquinone biosynthesis C-methylase UbiE
MLRLPVNLYKLLVILKNMTGKKSLKNDLKEHLLKTVGKKPLGQEMKIIDKQIQPFFNKIYDKPNKKESFIKEVYDKDLSKLWVKVVANEDFSQELKLLSLQAKIKPNFKITSIASGLGIFELFLAKKYVPSGKVICLDISSGMIKLAKSFASKLNQHNIKMIVSSATKIPVKSNSQDLVLARRTGLSNDKRWIAVLREAYGIIKKKEDSIFIFTVDKIFNKKHDEVKADLLKANFKLISIKDFSRNGKYRVSMVISKPIYYPL